jgi:hypothetical protein
VRKKGGDSKVVLFLSFHSLVYPVVVSTSSKVGRKEGKIVSLANGNVKRNCKQTVLNLVRQQNVL